MRPQARLGSRASPSPRPCLAAASGLWGLQGRLEQPAPLPTPRQHLGAEALSSTELDLTSRGGTGPRTHLTSHAHTLSGQQELPAGHGCADEDSTETHFPTAAKQREEEGTDVQGTCGTPGRTEAKALCPTGDPFDGQMQGSKRTELLHAGMTSSGREAARFCTRRTRHRGDTQIKPPTAGGGARENTWGHFTKQSAAFWK